MFLFSMLNTLFLFLILCVLCHTSRLLRQFVNRHSEFLNEYCTVDDANLISEKDCCDDTTCEQYDTYDEETEEDETTLEDDETEDEAEDEATAESDLPLLEDVQETEDIENEVREQSLVL